MLGFTVVVALTVLPQAQDSVTRVIVGPDYLVSRDGDRPHVEIMAAANPRDSKNLIAGAITFTRPDGGVASKVYATLDGGLTWTDFSFAKQMKMGGADPQVAFTRAGTAIFASLAIGPDETGRTRAFLHAYRSEDGGTSWSAPYDLGASYDHPMMIADQTDGRFAGRIYMSVLYGRDYHLGVFRSEDDGRSWIGPVEFISGEGERGLNVDQMLVLSEGMIVAPFIEFPFTPEMRGEWEESDRAVRFHTVTSSDGGVTFSAPKPGVVLYRGEYPERDHRYGLGVMYGVDRSERHRDRIFALWADPMRERLRTVISLSDDRGASWSAPRDVDPGAPAGAEQFQATVRVNQEGVVGVTWYDTRGTSGEMAFNQYFAASLDGGMSFTEPVRVSTVESKPFSSANLLPSATALGGSRRRTEGRSPLRRGKVAQWRRLHRAHGRGGWIVPSGVGRRAFRVLSGVYGESARRAERDRAGRGGSRRAESESDRCYLGHRAGFRSRPLQPGNDGARVVDSPQECLFASDPRTDRGRDPELRRWDGGGGPGVRP